MSATAAIHAASAISLETYLLAGTRQDGVRRHVQPGTLVAGAAALTAGIRLARLG
jgi:hypothetical protein